MGEAEDRAEALRKALERAATAETARKLREAQEAAQKWEEDQAAGRNEG